MMLKIPLTTLLASLLCSHVAFAALPININIDNSTGKIAKRTVQGKESGINGDFPSEISSNNQATLYVEESDKQQRGIAAAYEIQSDDDIQRPDSACLFAVTFNGDGTIRSVMSKHFLNGQCFADKIDEKTLQFYIAHK